MLSSLQIPINRRFFYCWQLAVKAQLFCTYYSRYYESVEGIADKLAKLATYCYLDFCAVSFLRILDLLLKFRIPPGIRASYVVSPAPVAIRRWMLPLVWTRRSGGHTMLTKSIRRACCQRRRHGPPSAPRRRSASLRITRAIATRPGQTLLLERFRSEQRVLSRCKI